MVADPGGVDPDLVPNSDPTSKKIGQDKPDTDPNLEKNRNRIRNQSILLPENKNFDYSTPSLVPVPQLPFLCYCVVDG